MPCRFSTAISSTCMRGAVARRRTWLGRQGPETDLESLTPTKKNEFRRWLSRVGIDWSSLSASGCNKMNRSWGVGSLLEAGGWRVERLEAGGWHDVLLIPHDFQLLSYVRMCVAMSPTIIKTHKFRALRHYYRTTPRSVWCGQRVSLSASPHPYIPPINKRTRYLQELPEIKF